MTLMYNAPLGPPAPSATKKASWWDEYISALDRGWSLAGAVITNKTAPVVKPGMTAAQRTAALAKAKLTPILPQGSPGSNIANQTLPGEEGTSLGNFFSAHPPVWWAAEIGIVAVGALAIWAIIARKD